MMIKINYADFVIEGDSESELLAGLRACKSLKEDGTLQEKIEDSLKAVSVSMKDWVTSIPPSNPVTLTYTCQTPQKSVVKMAETETTEYIKHPVVPETMNNGAPKKRVPRSRNKITPTSLTNALMALDWISKLPDYSHTNCVQSCRTVDFARKHIGQNARPQASGSIIKGLKDSLSCCKIDPEHVFKIIKPRKGDSTHTEWRRGPDVDVAITEIKNRLAKIAKKTAKKVNLKSLEKVNVDKLNRSINFLEWINSLSAKETDSDDLTLDAFGKVYGIKSTKGYSRTLNCVLGSFGIRNAEAYTTTRGFDGKTTKTYWRPGANIASVIKTLHQAYESKLVASEE